MASLIASKMHNDMGWAYKSSCKVICSEQDDKPAKLNHYFLSKGI